VLEEARPSLGDGVVAEPARLDGEVGRRMREVLGVPRLVEEGVPVVGPAGRLDDEDDAAGHLDRRAERPRRLRRTRLEVELDVLLTPKVDAHPRERGLQRRHHPLCRESAVPLRRAEEPRHVPARGLLERNANAGAEEPIGDLHVQLLRLLEEALALPSEVLEREAEAEVELTVRRGAERGGRLLTGLLDREVARVQLRLEDLASGAVEPLSPGAVRLVRGLGP
jgi:hypothetical protein